AGGPILDAASVGQQRLEYLRGWSANEGSGVGQFRARTVSKLGDIIDSNPWYVGQPQAGYSDDDHPGYAAFRASRLARKPVIYLGANDGMLHGFDASFDPVTNLPTATSGNEVLGYVPARVFGKLSKLTSQTYNSSHQYYVNSSPMVGDADFSSTGADWKTVLVSGLGQGGQGYFALNVTDPASFAESNAASLVLWEFTDQDDRDMGYTFNQPTVNSLNKLSAQIVRMNNNKWAVVVGNGYNNTEADGNASTTGHAVLYILYLSNTFSGTWTLGTDYIKITTGSGTLASPNGLATPLPVDTNGDGRVDLIYAGDLNGNMWKFDVSSASPASWGVANAGSPLFAAPAGQPITSAPQVFPHPNGGRMVLFGTGKFIETADASGPFATQTLYGVWDNGSTVTLSDLVAQTVTDTVSGAGTSFRTVSSNAVNYAGTSPAKGWFLNLPATGETVPFNTLIKSGLALFSSMIPSPDPCAFGGDGWLMALEPLTGWASASGSFDADGDGSITPTESVTTVSGTTLSVPVAGRKSTVGISPTPTILDVPSAAGGLYGSGGGGGDGMVYANGTGGLERFGLQGQPGSRGRIMWKEILQ
ncbi:MAG: pilus assembly protein, partial [Thiobacillus sp.]